MTALTLELSPELYARLRAEAERQGKPPEGVVEAWLAERLAAAPAVYDRERSIAAVRAAGLLAEPSEAMRRRAAGATMTLEEVRAALDQAEGKPLSEIILDQRGPKE
jgi:predicted transcriptional regulator